MFRKIIARHLKLISVLVFIIFGASIPLFVHSPYYLDLPIAIIVRAVVAMSFLLLLRSGMMNLGIAAFWGIGAYASAVLVMKLGLPFWLSLPASALVTGLIALGLGYFLIGSGSTGFSFAILTAVIGMLFSTVVGNIAFLGGHNGIANVPPPESIQLPFLPAIEFSINNKVPYFYLALFLLLVIVLILKAFYSSRIGRAWTAISLNPNLTKSVGVNIFRYKLLSFSLASAVAGLIGSFFAHYSGFVTPDSFGMWQNISVQIYAILGGMGYAILGPLLGASLMTLIPELLRIATEFTNIIIGALLILLIMFLPGGILSLIDKNTAIGGWIYKIAERLNPLRHLDEKENQT